MTIAVKADGGRSGGGGVQSLDRAFAILEVMADAGGMIGLSQVAERLHLPLATIHRLVRTLVDLGYVRQEPSRQYSLGPRLLRLADTTTQRIATWARPAMDAAVTELGESVNLAMLDGDEIVYVAGVQPASTFLRMFTEVGRRVRPHATAVGKAVLAGRQDAEVLALLRRTGMPRYTERTICDAQALLAELQRVRDRGYALDEGEQEVGVRCVAVVVPGAPQPMAVSLSGPLPRMADAAVDAAVPVLRRTAGLIAVQLGGPYGES